MFWKTATLSAGGTAASPDGVPAKGEAFCDWKKHAGEEEFFLPTLCYLLRSSY
jgi:hypothetical protein